MRSLKPELLATCFALGCAPQPQPAPEYQPVQYSQPAQTPMQTPTEQQQQQQQQPDPWSNTQAENYQWTPGRSHLGVVVQPMTGDLRTYFGAPPDRGVLVAHVAAGSPADQAGLQVGDVLVFADGRLVQNNDDLRSAISGHGRGTLRLDFIRRGAPMQVQVTIGEQPPSTPLM